MLNSNLYIKKLEFGDESLWLRLPPKNRKPGNTVKRLSFVLSFDDTDSSQGLEMVKDALEFLAFTMKKRKTGPVGGLLLNYLKDHAEGLYRHVTERHPSSYSAEETLTNDIDAQFQGGFTINTNARLNRYMVDYDIIRVLKNHVGYKSWDEVSSLTVEEKLNSSTKYMYGCSCKDFSCNCCSHLTFGVFDINNTGCLSLNYSSSPNMMNLEFSLDNQTIYNHSISSKCISFEKSEYNHVVFNLVFSCF